MYARRIHMNEKIKQVTPQEIVKMLEDLPAERQTDFICSVVMQIDEWLAADENFRMPSPLSRKQLAALSNNLGFIIHLVVPAREVDLIDKVEIIYQ